MSETKKVVCLFGAGATHAEKMYALRNEKVLDEKKFLRAEGLTNAEISLRVLTSLLGDNKTSYLISKYGLDENILKFPSDKKHIDIEFLITLIESNKTKMSAKDVGIIREYYRKDILDKLKYDGKEINPYLYCALLEWQKLNEKNEEVLGYLTLNYDTLFEKALVNIGHKINYGLFIEKRSQCANNETLLIKLHGSFNWFLNEETNKIQTENNEDQEKNEPLWIPPGLIKGYVDYPYNLLLGRARELLVECNLLRIVGCSLSPNDPLLISLIFGTQKLKRDAYSIEVIDSEKAYEGVLQKRLGFMLKLEESFYNDPRYEEWELSRTENPFRDWLVFNSRIMGPKELESTKYLKKLETGRGP